MLEPLSKIKAAKGDEEGQRECSISLGVEAWKPWLTVEAVFSLPLPPCHAEGF